MPILPAEPDLFPENLWEGRPIASESLRWWCLHTKPRQEKATARYLLNRRLSYYLPQIYQVSRTPKGRQIRSICPLFTSYVFLLGDVDQRLEAFRGDTLVNILEVKDQVRIEEDLRQIHRMLASGVPVAVEPSHPVGIGVRITSGPLTGVTGTVIRRGPRDRFVAFVHFLGSGAAVDLEDWQVERID